jgi:hypothetical protein
MMLIALPTAFAAELPRNFVTQKAPEPGAAVRFEDDRGQPRSLIDCQGKVDCASEALGTVRAIGADFGLIERQGMRAQARRRPSLA